MNKMGGFSVGRGVGVRKQVATQNDDGQSFSAVVTAFKHGAAPSTVREGIFSKLDQFDAARYPEEKDKLVAAQDVSGGNLLHQVGSFESDGSSVQKLVALGVDINATDKKGVTPLFYVAARKEDCSGLVSAFLQAGANPNAVNRQTGKSVLLEILLTRPLVNNLLVLLQDPDLEIPAKIKLSNGLEMDFSELIARTYKDPRDLRCINDVLGKKMGVL